MADGEEQHEEVIRQKMELVRQLPLPCVSTAFAAKTVPLPCGPRQRELTVHATNMDCQNMLPEYGPNHRGFVPCRSRRRWGF